MHSRKTFMFAFSGAITTAGLLAANLLAVCALAIGLLAALPAAAEEPEARRARIDAAANAALTRLRAQHPVASELEGKAVGLLVFPEITKGGLIVGVESGEGVLRSGGKSIAYYSTRSVSLGATIGLQSYGYALLFLSQEALDGFMARRGFEVGLDGNVTVLDLNAAAEIDTTNIRKTIIAFIFEEGGLMINAALEGTKFTRLDL